MTSPASPITLEQVTGPRRAMIFKGRSRPYRPLELPRTQRVTTTYFPGNPKATQQVLGPTFEPFTINGQWKDKFLLINDLQNGVDLLNFPPLAPGTFPFSTVAGGTSFIGTGAFPATQPAQLARVVVDAVSLLIAEGQDVRFQWDQIVRYGKITRFTPRYGEPTGGISDIGWELEFTPSGDQEASPIARPNVFNLFGIPTGLQAILAALLAVLRQIENLRQPNGWITLIGAFLGGIISLVSALIGAFRSIVNVISAPIDLLNTITGALQQLRALIQSALAFMRDRLSAYGHAAEIGKPEDVQIAAQVQQLLRKRLAELSAFAAEQARLANLFTGDEILATYFADSFTSLRDVAAKFYGDQTQWPAISTYNGFYSATVPRGTLVRVPRLD